MSVMAHFCIFHVHSFIELDFVFDRSFPLTSVVFAAINKKSLFPKLNKSKMDK